MCNLEEKEACTFEYTKIDDQKHKAVCKCGRNIEENHEFINGICTKCKHLEPHKILPGDVNLDDNITTTDAIVLKKHIIEIELLNGDALVNADLDSNGLVESTDLLQLKIIIIGIP